MKLGAYLLSHVLWFPLFFVLLVIHPGPALSDVITNPEGTVILGDLTGTVIDDVITNYGGVVGSIDGLAGADYIVNHWIVGDSIFGGAGADTIINHGLVFWVVWGDEGNDVIINHEMLFGISGDEGDDLIINYDYVDTDIDGFDGDDTIINYGDLGGGAVYGGIGNDRIVNHGYIDWGIDGEEGDDAIYNYGWVVLGILGFDGNDYIFNSGYIESGIVGEDGDDTIINHGEVELEIEGNDGNDVITNYGLAHQWISGNAGDDLIINHGVVDLNIEGNDGDDTISLQRGTVVGGNVDGGADFDTLILGSGVTVNFPILNFENFIMQGGGTSWIETNLDLGPCWIVIESGRLVVNGRLTSAGVSVGPGGVLAGVGTVLSNVGMAGRVAPGNSIGTLTIQGDYQETSTAVFELELNPAGEHDKLVVTGAAALGGTLDVIPERGFYPTGALYSNVLTAGGGISGRYHRIVDRSLVLDFDPVYRGNSMDVVVSRNSYTNFTSGYGTRAAKAAAGLDSAAQAPSADMQAVLAVIDFMPNEYLIGSALSQLHPEVYDGFHSAGFEAGRMFSSIVADRMDQARTGVDLGASGASGFGRTGLNSGGRTEDPRLGMFARAVGAWGDVQSNSERTGYQRSTRGFAGGLDYRLTDEMLAGVSFGYAVSELDFKDRGESKGRVDHFRTTLFASYSPGDWRMDAALGYGLNWNSLGRKIRFLSGDENMSFFSRTAQGDFLSHELSASLAIGRDLHLSERLTLTPRLSANYAHLIQEGFAETGAGALNLSVDPLGRDSLQATAGAGLSYLFKHKTSWKIIPEASFAYTREFLDDSSPISARFQGGGASFDAAPGPPERDWADIRLSLNALNNDRAAFYIRYDGRFSGQSQSHGLSAGLKYSF